MSSPQYEILIALLKQDIENSDIKSLTDNLMRIPFEKLNQNTVDKLLSTLINHTVTFESTESIKIIFDVIYQQLEITNGQLDHLTRLFCDITITPEALQLVAKTFDDKSIEYYVEHLINYDSDPMTMIGAKNLEPIFVVDYHIWQYLFYQAVENELEKGYTNRLIKDFIETKMVETAPFLPKPDWIINDFPTIPFDDHLLLQAQQQQDTEKLQLIADSSAEEENKIIESAYALSIERYQLNFNKQLFQWLGPSNVQMSENLLIDDICHKYGGCRMLTCVEYEQQYLNDDSVDSFDVNYQDDAFDKTEWFTGSCDVCFNKIQFKHYAVRLPLWRGGWLGCYCSWDCVRKTLNNEIVTADLIDTFEAQLNTIGIQDRRYR